MAEEYEDLILVEEGEEYQDEFKEPKIGLFDLINDISNGGKFIEVYYDDHGSLPKEYNIYMVNKAFSHFTDTIMMANEMNKWWSIPDFAHWSFMKNTISKRKRYSKWFKNLDDPEPVELLSKLYGCSVREMRKNMTALPKEKWDEILSDAYPEKYGEGKKSKRKR